MDVYISGKTGEIITVGTKISKGGEGTIFDVINSTSSLCFKLYLEKLRTEEREKKLKYMSENAPTELSHKRFLLCWPLDVVYCNGAFVGYIMEKAFMGSQAPYHLCLPDIPDKIGSVWSTRFKRGTKEGEINRLKLCLNIAAAVARIHQTNKYVLVDLKPQNLLVTTDGKVSLIDLDSLQISDGITILFKAPVSTPEYTPPEAKTIIKSAKPIPESWDSFSLGVIIYEILCGIHPFAATADVPFNEVNTISEKIEKQLSPLICDQSAFKIIPPPHQLLDLHSDKLKNLLRQIFIGSPKNEPPRPTIETIGKTLFDEIGYYRIYAEKIEAQQNIHLINELKKDNQNLKNQEKWLTERWEESKKEVENLKSKSKNGTNKGVMTLLVVILIILGTAFISTYLNQENIIYSLKSANENKLHQEETISELRKTINNQNVTITNLKGTISNLKANYPPFSIKTIEFKSTKSSSSGDYKTYINYGETLSKQKCYYLHPKLEYFAVKSGTYDIYVKFYDPKGNMKTWSQSPYGYSFCDNNMSISEGNNTINLSGWGSDDGTYFESGWYRYEIWVNSKILAIKELYISFY